MCDNIVLLTMKRDLIQRGCLYLAVCLFTVFVFNIEWVQAQQASPLPAVTLERALYLETMEGDSETASQLYVSVFSDKRTGARTRAESALMAAECFDTLDELLLAKFYYEFLIHDEKRFSYLSTRADDGLYELTDYLMEDSGNIAAKDFQWIGDLLIGLEGALKREKTSLASGLIEELVSALQGLRDAHAELQDQRFIDAMSALAADLSRAMDTDSPTAAMKRLLSDPHVRVFRQRTHFAESDEVFSPALVNFDKIAEALIQQHVERTISRCDNLLSYLEPLKDLSDASREERELAHRFIDAVSLIRDSIRRDDWDAAWRAWLAFRRDCSSSDPLHFHLGDFIGQQLADFSFYPQFAVVVDRFLFAEDAAKAGNSDAVKQALKHNHGLLKAMHSKAQGTFDEDLIHVYLEIVEAMMAAFESEGVAAVLPLLEAENVLEEE